jgi:hypothetical protein
VALVPVAGGQNATLLASLARQWRATAHHTGKGETARLNQARGEAAATMRRD